jgi:hypothetical protein
VLVLVLVQVQTVDGGGQRVQALEGVWQGQGQVEERV